MKPKAKIMSKEIKTRLIQYPGYYEERGWGCGYVDIPIDHPFMIVIDLENIYNVGIDQEITWNRALKNDPDYWTIGFDTGHSYNNVDYHNKDWVKQETLEIARIVAKFTKAHATVMLAEWLDNQYQQATDEATRLCNKYNIEL